MIRIEIAPRFEDWRTAARALLSQRVPPEQVTFVEADASRPAGLPLGVESESPSGAISVPKRFVELAIQVSQHPDPARWGLLYRLLWRLVHETRDLLRLDTDADVSAAKAMARAHVAAQPSLLGERQPPISSASIFLPLERSLPALRDAAARCTGCALYRTATQTVFGAGPADARAMFIGEQPGDQEDLQGNPFVGPAGEVLDRALAEAGIARHEVYITNAVKHFKWEPRGKRRIHMTPRQPEIEACRPWLEAEIDLLKPAAIVCLGATAAQTVLGPQFRVMRNRGQIFRTRWAPWLMTTIHPSAILRVEDPSAQQKAYAEFVSDLKKVAACLEAERQTHRSTR